MPKPDIPETIMKEMAAFFMRTSVPRILEDRKRREGEAHGAAANGCTGRPA